MWLSWTTITTSAVCGAVLTGIAAVVLRKYYPIHTAVAHARCLRHCKRVLRPEDDEKDVPMFGKCNSPQDDCKSPQDECNSPQATKP